MFCFSWPFWLHSLPSMQLQDNTNCVLPNKSALWYSPQSRLFLPLCPSEIFTMYAMIHYGVDHDDVSVWLTRKEKEGCPHCLLVTASYLWLNQPCTVLLKELSQSLQRKQKMGRRTIWYIRLFFFLIWTRGPLSDTSTHHSPQLSYTWLPLTSGLCLWPLKAFESVALAAGLYFQVTGVPKLYQTGSVGRWQCD